VSSISQTVICFGGEMDNVGSAIVRIGAGGFIYNGLKISN
jgi:hypothetical protein